MLHNVVLKKFLKCTIFKFFTSLNKIVPKDENKILIYAPTNAGIAHNSRAIYEYLIEKNYNGKYRIFCSVTNMRYREYEHKNVKFISQLNGILQFFTSGHVIYSYGQIPIKPSFKQIVIQTWHGVGFKACGKLSDVKNGDEFYFTYKLINSDIYLDICTKEWGCMKKNLILCGEPVTDVFFKKNIPYNFENNQKVILWTPTFRQSDYLGYNDSDSLELLSIFDEEDYVTLNENLAKNDVKLIVKLHGAQNLNSYKHSMYSHLEIYSHDDFTKSGYELYHMLAQVDALIADYSSIFLQFLLLDRPIAFVCKDFEEYKQKRGFVFSNPEKYMPGLFIKTQNDFYRFIKQIHIGLDEHQTDRHIIKNIIHKYQDGNNCERVVNICNIYK